MAPAVCKRPAGAAVKVDAAANKRQRKAAVAATAPTEAAAATDARGAHAAVAESLGCPVEAYEGVMAGVAMAEHLSETCREMLLTAVPKTLGVPMEQRVAQQVAVIDMLEETLSEVAEGLQAAIEAAEAEVSAAEGSKAQVLEKVQQEEAHAAAKAEAVQAKQAALNEVASAFADAKMALADRRREGAATAEALAKASADLAAVEDVNSSHFKMLLEGTWEGEADAKEAEGRVMSLLATCHTVEDSLMAAIPPVLLKRPEERGTFDVTLMAECKQRFEAKLAALHEQVASLQAAHAEPAAALEAAQAECDARSRCHSAAAEELVAAQAEHQTAADVLKSSWANVAEAEVLAAAAAAKLDDRRRRLADFQARSVGGFEALTGRSATALEAEPMKVDPPALSASTCAVVAGA